MQEVILVIHLILALTIIVLVLLQRSSGGGLGVGGSGGMGDFATARGAANALSKTTTICAFLFFATSLSLAFIAKGSSGSNGILSSYDTPAAIPAPAMPADPNASPADTITEPKADAAPAAPATPEPPISSE